MLRRRHTRGVRFLSVCSGIEAASCAWEPLGFEPVAFAEIDPFASAVLAHRYPNVPNLGDFTQIGAEHVGAVDLLVGGTPCQDFSVAGLRAGLAGDRGRLTVEFVRLLERVRPGWFVWENVPGVLSVDGGRAFGAFLGLLGKCGYGFAYRVLDAQYFGVPQRRRRVFVVGCLGEWRRAAAVLFERDGVRGDPAPRRKARPGTTTIAGDGAGDGVTQSLTVGLASGGPDAAHAKGGWLVAEPVAHTLCAEGHDASEDGTGRGVPLVATTLQAREGRHQAAVDSTLVPTIAFSCKDSGDDVSEDLAPTLRGMEHRASSANGGGQLAVTFAADVADPIVTKEGATWTHEGNNFRTRNVVAQVAVAVCETCHGVTEMSSTTALQSAGGKPGQGYQAVRRGAAVRRLTPTECERLQGFPDGWTAVPYRHGKPAADAPRYRALGNSMAVPVMRWIGERLAMVERLD
jgi:DNA (cytosine-5)-methyltransferase 1